MFFDEWEYMKRIEYIRKINNVNVNIIDNQRMVEALREQQKELQALQRELQALRSQLNGSWVKKSTS